MSTIDLSSDKPVRAIHSITEAAEILSPRPGSADKIGVEAEAFLIHARTAAPAQAETFLNTLTHYKNSSGFEHFITEQKADGGTVVIGLTGGTGLHSGADITVEPGFQPEYGSAPKDNLHETAAALDKHLNDLSRAAAELGHRVVLPGLHPLAAGDDLPLIEKKRYAVMTEDARRKAGSDGLTAMRGTTGIQYNLDTSPDNWERRYRTAFLIQPFVNALSGNSPFKNAERTGDASHRSVLWFENWGGNWAHDIAGVVLAEDFSLLKLTDYIANHLRLPFLVRQAPNKEVRYIRLDRTFSDLLSDRPEALGGLTETDVAAMVGFAFLPVKPKQNGVIELRGADGSYTLRHAQGAFEVGILYDDKSLRQAESLLKGLTAETYVQLTKSANRSGINAIVPSVGSVREIAQELAVIARNGLLRRGLNEQIYLRPISEIANGTALTPGDTLVKRVNQIQRVNRSISARKAIAQAFLETAIPVEKAQALPIRLDRAAAILSTSSAYPV